MQKKIKIENTKKGIKYTVDGVVTYEKHAPKDFGLLITKPKDEKKFT